MKIISTIMLPIKWAWIMLATGLVILNTAVKAIVRVRLNLMTRTIADRYIKEWSRRILKVVNVKISKVYIEEPLNFQAQHGYILMSNHASHYDIPIIFQSIPGSIRMLAKKELFKIPLFGRMLKENEFPSVDRENRKQAILDLERAGDIMRSGIILWIAPEGKRTKDPRHLNEFKKGGFILAIKSKAIIIPIGIRGAANILPADTWDFSTGEQVEVHVGKPINAADFKLEEKDILRARIEREIARLANVATDEEFYEEGMSSPSQII